MKITKFIILLLLSSLTLVQTTWADSEQRAAVAMPDSYSADIAAQVLKDGGNAIDAAIAAAFSLAVTLPEAGNIGGGGFMLLVHQGKTDFLDYREMAPQKAHRDMYLDEAKNVIPDLSIYGALSSGVPGTVMGMWQAHKKYGSLPWRRLIEPAITLANDGFIIHPKLARSVQWFSKSIADNNSLNFDQYFSQAKVANAVFKQPELAKTLTLISEQGADGFYKGKTADLIVAQMKKSGGLISHDDLMAYQSQWRTPLTKSWQGYDVVSAPPPSSGGIIVLQLLKMKALLNDKFSGLERNSAGYIHLLAEIEKRAYADRAKYMGDPDFYPVPVTELLADDYLKSRVSNIGNTISETEKVKPGLKESHDTTHFSIIDQWGNAVSNTYTINLTFGSGLVVEGAGFILNDEMDDFSSKPGVANAFGVMGGKANEIAPKKRMLSSMSPTILLKDNQPVLVTGSPGGTTIITSVFQSIVNMVEFNLTAQQATDSLRVHHQLLPENQIRFAGELLPTTKAELSALGYNFRDSSYGDLHIVSKLSGVLDAGSDKRGRGKAQVITIKSSSQ